jgi:hypothetical protein
MSIRAVFIALAFAIGVVILALFYGQSAKSGNTHASVLSFDPTALTALEIQDADSHHRIQRTPDGGWDWVDANNHTISWPAIYPGSAQTAVGALSALESERMPDADPISGESWLLRFEVDSTTSELRVSKEQLGGLSRAENSNTDRFLIDASLIRPLVEPGLSSWRISRALPGLYDASRIWIEKQGQTLALARVNNEWNIIQPVAARADTAAVSALIDTIAQLNVERFEQRAERTNADLGIDAPTTTLRLQRDARRADASGNVTTETTESTLFVGSTADPQGALLHAANNPHAKLLLLVSSANLAAIPTEPKTLLATTASSALPSDVFGINIRTLDTEISASRSMGAWSGASESDATALLDFLCTTQGEPNIFADDDEIIALSRVELTALDSGRLDLISLGYTADGIFAARAGNVIWLYPSATPPALLVLPSFKDIPERTGSQTNRPPTDIYTK